MSVRRRNKIGGQFSARLIEMMESPAFQVLSLAGRRILDRLEIEIAHHGGNDNGKLPVTFDNFVEYGIHRHSIAPGLREVCALGFVEITERGRAGNAEWRRPSLYRLTYRQVGNAKATDEWKHITTVERALEVAHAARRQSATKKPRTARRRSAPKNRTPVPVSAKFQCGNHHRKVDSHSTETVTTGLGAETVTTSISRGG
jgi:hypothetical protein